jgi:threonine/homoserine/homoserine lactone efflux protein
MTDWTAFLLASLALLATPGPTNTLLGASGAAAGFVRSLKLLPAEAAGYTIAISMLALAVGPVLATTPVVGMVLKLACAAWLAWSAYKLWREGSDAIVKSEPVPFNRVFITTLLNPKAIVFAFVIMPYMKDGRFADAMPYLAALLGLIACVAMAWIGTGALIRASHTAGAGLVRKVGAAALALFGVLLSTSALTAGK